MNEIDPPAVKDEEHEYPIAGAWRSAFRGIVAAFAEGDFQLARGIDSVDPVSAELAEGIREYVGDYGETLVELPDETWESSVALWMGDHWEVLVDLWTEKEGQSDLVLHAFVREAGGGYRYEIHLVNVP